MIRTLTCVLALLLCLPLAARADDPPKGKKGKFARDPEKIFEFLDADKDGKLTKEEFKKITEKLAELGQGKLKDKPELLEKIGERLFEKLDADKDGTISKEEFKKFGELAGDREKLRELIKKKLDK